MSIRKMLVESRRSGPAIKYETEPDGTRVILAVQAARPPNSARRLSREEILCVMTQTGEVPEQFLAPGWCGVQANDNDPTGRLSGAWADGLAPVRDTGREISADLDRSNVMRGYADPTAQPHPAEGILTDLVHYGH